MSIEHARQLITAAKRPASFSGAGLSAESGISTFRDARQGLWAKYDPALLASPQGFAANPEMVIEWYALRRRTIAAAEPNAAHRALATLDWPHITQNVDDLLHRAGACNVLQLHGSIMLDRCHGNCGYEETIDPADPPALRNCPKCPSPMRPGVVWFGESLPMDAWHAAEQACTSCDVLLVIGTSAVVYPAAGLISVAKSGSAKVIIVNTTASDASDLADVELIGPAGELVPKLLAS